MEEPGMKGTTGDEGFSRRVHGWYMDCRDEAESKSGRRAPITANTGPGKLEEMFGMGCHSQPPPRLMLRPAQ